MINKNKLLVFMYWYTALGAGVCGLAIIFFPGLTQVMIRALMPLPGQDSFIFGYMGSALMAFGIVAALGISRPKKFMPVLLLQLVYKTIWICMVLIPNAARGEHPLYAVIFAAIFITYVIGDILALPFGELLAKE